MAVGSVLRFSILGPLEVLADGQPVPLGGPQQRGLLALLLLEANRVISQERLVADLWGDDPPATARVLLHGCVAGLRRALPEQRLVTRSPGYLLRVGPGELDADRFEELADCPDVESLRAALELWRGPALHGLPPGSCRIAAVRLDERRLLALERRIDLDLRLERFAELAAELAVLVRKHPLRERLWAQLIVALSSSGRQAEALAAFRRLRATLVEELGIEPSALPRQIQQAVLTGGDALGSYWLGLGVDVSPPPRAPVAPAQLPAPISGFAGRAGDLARLDAVTGTVVVSGPAGVGKTALAVQWAHRVRERFGDGQLYVNLRGHSSMPPLPPIEALGAFLPALGIPADEVPMDLDRAASLYRTLLADRRMLLVLDNAGSAEQVRPLLPASPGSVVLVTSRYDLGGLIARNGARHLALGVLTPAEADELLVWMLGRSRVEAERGAAAELARRCGFLPLALRIAAANLTLHPDQTITGHVAHFAAGDGLGWLTVVGDDQTAVRAAFDHSYTALRPEAARLFRLLGLVPGPDFGAPAAAALAGEAEPVQSGLALLVDANLLTRPAPGRYAFHDLIRLYAAERARDDPDREAALTRLLDWHLHGADAAARMLYPERRRLPVEPAGPDFETTADALAWLDTERAGLVAAARLAAERGPGRVAWLLADTLRGYFWRRMCTVDWSAIASSGLAAATAAGHLAGQAGAELCLADLHRAQGRYEVAIEHYSQALAGARAGGWADGAAVCLTNLGTAYFWLGRLPEAADSYRQRLDVAVRTGQVAGEAAALGNLGLVYALQGQLESAAEHHERALALHRGLGSRQNEAVNLANLGDACHQLGRLDAAYDHLTAALSLHREVGDRGAEAESLRLLAEVWLDQGKHERALDHATRAVTLATDTDHAPVLASTLNTLGEAHLRLGGPAQARAAHERALRLARDAGTRHAEVVALTGLAASQLGLGDPGSARSLAEQALTEAERSGHRVLLAEALTTLLRVHLDTGARADAIAAGHRALELHRATGHRLGEARTGVLLGRALDPEPAQAVWRCAVTVLDDIGVPEAADARALLEG